MEDQKENIERAGDSSIAIPGADVSASNRPSLSKPGIIYKATNLVNGKIYVGKTISTLHRRQSRHLSDAKSHRGNSAFHSAIRKYGYNNFAWEILDKTIDHDLLLNLEMLYIKTYNSQVPYGYNLTLGGQGMFGYRYSEESKKKMSNAWKYRKVSDGTRAKLRAASLGRRHSDEAKRKCRESKIGNKNPNFGKRPTAETIEKHRVANAGYRHSEETKRKISDARRRFLAFGAGRLSAGL